MAGCAGADARAARATAVDAVRANRARVNASLTTAGLRLMRLMCILSTSSVEDGQKVPCRRRRLRRSARVWRVMRRASARGRLRRAASSGRDGGEGGDARVAVPARVTGHVTRHSRSDLTLNLSVCDSLSGSHHC